MTADDIQKHKAACETKPEPQIPSAIFYLAIFATRLRKLTGVAGSREGWGAGQKIGGNNCHTMTSDVLKSKRQPTHHA